MLDPRDLSLEGIKRLCQADMTWKLVPLYDCPGEEGKACVVFVYPSTGDIGTLGAQFLFVNKDSHQLLQGGFLFYKGWSAWNLLFFVRGISSLDHEACQIHWMYYGTFLLPTLLPSSEPSLTDILACVLFCRLLWDFFIHFGSHTVLQYSSLGRTIDL